MLKLEFDFQESMLFMLFLSLYFYICVIVD